MELYIAATVLVLASACDSEGGGEGARMAPPLSVAAESGGPRVEALPSPAGPGSLAPSLSPTDDGVWMSWLEPDGEGNHRLLVAEWRGRLAEKRDRLEVVDTRASPPGGWTPPREVVRSDRLFVNWADFPLVLAQPDGRLWAHWLERGGNGTYDYAIRLVSSHDSGASWSQPVTLHDDASPTEHGFLSAVAIRSASPDSPSPPVVAFAWLDGREMASGAEGPPADPEMTLRYREVSAPVEPVGASDGSTMPGSRPTPSGTRQVLIPGPEVLLDGRTCECCQTDMALTPDGPIVVYRDRGTDELRDVYIARKLGDAWAQPRPVHQDGWYFGGCPVNGPAVATSLGSVAVAWFTAANDQPSVQVAISEDFGATFGPPTRIDEGDPIGRVDLVGGGDGSFLALWLERNDGGDAVLSARSFGDGDLGERTKLAVTGAGRASGFPRAALDADGAVVVAWTDAGEEVSSVRVARITGLFPSSAERRSSASGR